MYLNRQPLSVLPWSLSALLLLQTASAQSFGLQQVITTSAERAKSVYATDLDGDGDADVLSASGNNIAWYENLGGGSFGLQQVITTAAVSAQSVYAIDLDGDGDADVLSASAGDDKIAWYENLGSGSFGPQQLITTPGKVSNSALFPESVYATDLDGDGDADVLSASSGDNKVAWYENLGSGSFGAQRVITTSATDVSSVYATDVDGDGDADVLFCPGYPNFYENLGGGVFVSNAGFWGGNAVYAADLDGDGDADAIGAGFSEDEIRWSNWDSLTRSYKFYFPVTNSADGPTSVYAIDLDGDGDADVLSASYLDNKIAWYENLGGGSFGPQQVITVAALGARSVYATDLDGDGDADVLSASFVDNKIAWYENVPRIANDDCSSANPIGLGETIFSTAGAGDSDVVMSCVTNGELRDVWFSYTAVGDFSVTIDLAGSAFDTGVVVYSGDCGALTQIVCNGEGPLSFSATAGTTYTIQVGGVDGAFGDGVINVLANDDCSGAIPIGLGETVFSNVGAGDSLVDMGCVFAGERSDLWFSYTAQSDGAVTLDLSGSSFDTAVAVHSGDCSALTPINCDDDSGVGLTSRLSFTAAAGTTYYIQVGGWNGTSGQGAITISEGLVDLVCPGNANSTGVGALLEYSGSFSVANNSLTLTVSNLPQSQGVLFVNSPEKIFVANPGGSQGDLCIGSDDLGRHVNDILNSGATGTATLALDLSSIPTAAGLRSVVAGETRYWQAWYRDVDGTGSATSNFSSAIGVTFN